MQMEREVCPHENKTVRGKEAKITIISNAN